jgi:CheY-like chemotaxis protein
MLLKAIVQNQGHTPLVAADGAEAIILFDCEQPDIILLDALMPNVDGFETARYVKAKSGDHFVPIIFLTSLNETDSLVHCLEAGGDDFLTKPYNSVILRAKIHAFERMLRLHVTLEQQRDVIAEHNRRLIQEQEVAKRTFDKIAHRGALNAQNIRYAMSPIAVFNGDVLLASFRPNGNLCVILGDFTGHGLAAAIGAMPLSQSFYSMVAKGFCIRDIAVEMNRKLKELLPVGVFCCATIIDMDLRNKTIEIWNGGMPDNYLYHAAEDRLLVIPSRHLPLGILPQEKFRARTDLYPMHNGDRFFLWSDGIIEAVDETGQMFGEERLKAVFRNGFSASSLYDEVIRAVQVFVGTSHPADDLSIAEVAMVDPDEFDPRQVQSPADMGSVPGDWGFSYEVRPVTLRAADPLPILQKILMELPGLRPHSGELFTVLSELYSNSLEHGLLGLDSSLKTTSRGFADYYRLRSEKLAGLWEGFIRFELDYHSDMRQSCLVLRVVDSGAGFDYRKHAVAQESEGYSGRGLHLIRSICSKVEYQSRGNQVEVTFDWHS